MESLQRINLYVTFVEKEGPFLKLYGQTDKNNSLYVEQFLAQVAPQFDLGVGKISPETLPPGTLICAKYKDNKYYRAKILNSPFVREGSLEVSFIDFGNKGIVSTGSIRSFHNFQSTIISIPPLAVGFIFAEAHCVGGGEWNDTIFESIAKEIKYREVQCTLLSQATNYFLVRIVVEGTDLCSILIQRGLMQPISLQAQQAVLLSMSMQKQGSQSQNHSTSSSNPQINTYKACSLEPGCQYPVYVSYVNDGPCHFSVQLKQTEDALVMLMNDINSINLRLLEDIPIPGTICLARCIEDSNICRAVVTNEVDTQFKVFYVDFGNYEVLPLEALYQIPFKYVLPKVMAIRFALAGVEKSTVTMEMQIAFKKFVDNRLLHMKVLPSPTRTALPKCELCDPETKTSALDVVIRSAKHSYPEPVALTRGFSQPVKVSFVYSCSRFYVQLVNKESELASLMTELQEVCMSSDPMDPTAIKVDLPCCALFSADGLWYRSQVVEVVNDNIKVRYIDYGNEETVPVDQLKTIEGEILTVLRPQAIECCLNGYQNMEPDDERDALLEELILEGVFTMKVVDTLNKKTLVDLFDGSDYNVASLLLDKLAAAKSQMSPVLAVQAGNKIEHRKSYTTQREQQNFNKGEKNYNTGREQKSWDKPNDRSDRNERTEKSWRQDNRENRNYDKNSNENEDKNSWRQNNKGFSPNNRFDKPRQDSWNTNDNTVNNNADWEDSTKSNPKPKDSWNKPSNNASQDTWNNKDSNNEWGTPANNIEDDRPQRNDFKGGYNNREGTGGGDRYGGKPRDGFIKKREYRKDESESSFGGSEKGFHKGPRSSTRNDNTRGGHTFDKPRNTYNRDNRNGGGDSWNATTTTEDSWNVSAVTPSIDAAPATATFNDYDVIGTEENVLISWFHNPGLFYVQQVNCQATFKTMMEEICEFYKDKKPDRVAKGAPIIALFDEDKVLYRARVVEVLGTQYKVYYVDFGNVSTVSKAYPIEKKFMDLPAQAIPCSLNGISPPSGEWADPDSYSSYFDKETFLCRFVNKDEEKTYVNIFLDTEDIGQLLVNDGLAVSTGPSVPDIEIPLLLGQQFRAIVKSVNNLSDIILALECGLAIGCTMHNLETAVESFEDVLKGLLEQAVIVYVDNVLEDYRLEVTLYDTEGNKHVVLNPDDGAFETVDIPCPMLVLRSVISGYVPHADETSVYIQPNDYADLVISLLDQLFEEYDGKEHDSTIIPEEGMLYAIHSEDGNWYRGKVISFDDEKATVNYVDYGNSEDVAFVELRELATKFLNINILSLQVNISSGAESFIDKNVTANIYFGEAGWEGTLQLLDSSHTAAVAETEVIESLESTDTGFATSSIEKPDNLHELTENTESTVVMENEAPISVPLEEEKNVEPMIGNMVIMSHIDTPSDFYLQFYEAIDEINALQAELQENVPELEVLENPIHGSLCAAPYSADQQWYRAEVLDADEDITTVRFIDFGNTDVIDNNTTKVKTLPPKLLSLAIYATRCALKIQPIEEEWSSMACTLFETLSNAGTLTAEFYEQDEKCTYVDLYTDGINIREALIRENFAKSATKATEGNQTGFVSHLNSPSEFWIQLENCVDELEWIAEQLSNAESFPELEELTPGTLCAALFPDDQMWYRARILSNTVAGIELLFIDYGNCCTSSSLRQLPEDLVITAPLALKCSLQKNEGISTWSPEAATKFSDISADGQAIFTVKKISTGETSVVQLLLNGQDVTTMLLPSTEEGLVKEVETLEKLSIERENGENVEVALEPLDGQVLDEEAKEKFEELNEQGSTRFQIEFVDEKTVRLYLAGKDIRPLLGSFKNAVIKPPKFVELDTTNSLDASEDTAQPQDEIAEKNFNSQGSLDANIDCIINENISEEQVQVVFHPEISDKIGDVQEKCLETDLEAAEPEIKSVLNVMEPLLDDDSDNTLITTYKDTTEEPDLDLQAEPCEIKDNLTSIPESELVGEVHDEDAVITIQLLPKDEYVKVDLEESAGLTCTTDSNIHEVQLGPELETFIELSEATDSEIQAAKIDTDLEASNECAADSDIQEIKICPASSDLTDSDFQGSKIGPGLEAASELTCTNDSDTQEVKLDTKLEASSGVTDSDIQEVKIGLELETSNDLTCTTDSDIQEVKLDTELESSNKSTFPPDSDISEIQICTDLEASSGLTGTTDSGAQEVKICTDLEATDSDIQEVKIGLELETSNELTCTTDSDTQKVKLDTELVESSELTEVTDSGVQEVKICTDLEAADSNIQEGKIGVELEASNELTCTTDSNTQEVKLDTELEATCELTRVTDSDMQEVQIDLELETSNDLTCTTDSDIQEVKLGTELESSNKSICPPDSDINEIQICTELEASSGLNGTTDSGAQQVKMCTDLGATDSDIQEVKIGLELETSNDLTCTADSDTQEVKLDTELESTCELTGVTDSDIQEVKIDLELETSNELTCTTDSDTQEVKLDTELESTCELTGVTDSDIQEVKIGLELETSNDLTCTTDSDIQEVKLGTELESSNKSICPPNSDINEIQICTELEAADSDIQEDKVGIELEASNELTCTTDSDTQKVKLGSELEASNELTEATDSVAQEVKICPHLEASNELTCTTDSDTKEVKLVTALETSNEVIKIDSELEASEHSSNKCKPTVEYETETTKSLISESKKKKNLNSSKETVEKNIELILVTNIDLQHSSGNTEHSSIIEECPNFKDDLKVSTSVENTIMSVEQYVEGCTVVQVHLEGNQGLSEEYGIADDVASPNDSINDHKESTLQEKTDCSVKMDQEQVEDQHSTAAEDHLKDILIDSTNAEIELIKPTLTEDEIKIIKKEIKTLKDMPVETEEDSKNIKRTKELPKEKKPETLPNPKKEISDNTEVTHHKQSLTKLDKSVKLVDRKSPSKEVTTPKKSSPIKTKDDNKITSAVKDSKSSKKASLPVSSSKTSTSKSTPSKVGVNKTKLSPIRTSLSIPKNITAKKEDVAKVTVKHESPTKSSPKKSPVKDVNLKKIESDNSESIVKGVLKDVVDLACAGDNNHNLQSENSDVLVHEREK